MLKKFLSMFVALIMLLALVSISTVGADSTNLITNGSFDTDSSDGWTMNSGSWSVVDGALFANPTHASWQGELTYSTNVTSGKIYVYSGKIKATNESKLNYIPVIKENKNTSGFSWAINSETNTNISPWVAGNKISMSAEDEWVSFVRVFTANADTATYSGNVTIGVYGETPKTSFYVDDITLAEFDVKTEIICDNAVEFPGTTITTSYKNIGGGTEGVSSEGTNVWSLVEPYEGVAIDSETGEITMEPTTLSGKIEVKVESTISSSYLEGGSKTVTATKEIDIIGVRPEIKNLVAIVKTSDDKLLLDSEYDYINLLNTEEQGTTFKWETSASESEGYTTLGETKESEITVTGNEDKYLKLTVLPQSTDTEQNKYAEEVSTTPIKVSELIEATGSIGAVTATVTAVDGAKSAIGTVLEITASDEVDYSIAWYRNEVKSDIKDTKYTLTEDDADSEISAKITPYTVLTGYKILGVEIESENKVNGPATPTATDVEIEGTTKVGNTLTGTYKHNNANGLGEGESIYSWVVGGSTRSESSTYEVRSSDAGKTVKFTVTPVSADGMKGESVSVSVTISERSTNSGGHVGSASSTVISGKPSVVEGSANPKPVTPPVDTSFKGFSDTLSHWANETIVTMYQKGIAKGDGDNFYPDNQIKRAETTAFLRRALGLDDMKAQSNNFSDINTSDWYSDDMNLLAELGIVNGTDGKANPLNTITRQELACFVMRAVKYKIPDLQVGEGSFFFDEGEISDWAAQSVKEASALGFVEGINMNFKPQKSATRAETLTVLKRMMDYIEKNEKTEG